MISEKVRRRRLHLDARAIGQRIRKARMSKGWTQAELGQAVGMAAKTVACWESGFRVPPIRTLVNLSVHLRRSLDWLVAGVPRRGGLWALADSS